MGKKALIRIWQETDIDAVRPHLLIVGNTSADCGNCKEVGVDIYAKSCPKCGNEFKYAGTRLSASPGGARRLKTKRPDLILIDYSDFKGASVRDAAKGFFNGD